MKKNQSTSAKLTLEEFNKLTPEEHERRAREETAALTPEQREERMRCFRQAMRDYLVELENAKIAANPGINNVH